MKVITIESSAFQTLTEQISEIASFVRKCGSEREPVFEDKLVDTNEAARLLHVSRRTLQRMRTEHTIEYAIIRGRCMYWLSEINRYTESCAVRTDESNIDNLKHNYLLCTGGNRQAKKRR
ncbi:MAG: helix-turn-helix domain-containing protein [Prevotella sp.]|nr:helix-turn-helix domain-containing protein [Prevotella sp.]